MDMSVSKAHCQWAPIELVLLFEWSQSIVGVAAASADTTEPVTVVAADSMKPE